MQLRTYAPRFDRTFSHRTGRRYAIGLVAIALLLTLPLPACGQGMGQATGQGTLTAPLATPAAPPPSSTPSPAAAALPGEHMISSAELPEDLSPWGMFENSDLVVKAVIIGLAFASLVTWTVWLTKTLELRSAHSEVRRDLRVLNNSVTLAQARDQLREGNG